MSLYGAFIMGHRSLVKVELKHCPTDSFTSSRFRSDFLKFKDFVAADPPEIKECEDRMAEPDAANAPLGGFVKDEPHSIKKLAEDALRTIFSRDPADRVLEIRLQWDYCKRVIAQWRTRPLKNSWAKWHDGVQELYRYFTNAIPEILFWEEMDFQGWDERVPVELEELEQEIYMETKMYDDPLDRIRDLNMNRATNGNFVIDHTGHVWWCPNPGISGKFKTAVANGKEHLSVEFMRLYRYYGPQRAEEWRKFFCPAVVGDDGLNAWGVEPPPLSWTVDFIDSLGMKIKEGTYKLSRDFVGMSFIGVRFLRGPHGELTHTLKYERALAKLLFYRREWNVYEVAQVLDAFRAETLHNSEVKKFVSIAMQNIDLFCEFNALEPIRWRPQIDIQSQYWMLHSRGKTIPDGEILATPQPSLSDWLQRRATESLNTFEKFVDSCVEEFQEMAKPKAQASSSHPKPKSAKPKGNGKAKATGPASSGPSKMGTKRVSAPAVSGAVIKRSGAQTTSSFKFRGSDYFGSLEIPSAQANANGTVLQWTPLNPLTLGNARLKQLAKMYQDYKVKSFRVRGNQAQGTGVGGLMAAFFDTDVARISSAQGDQMISYAMTHAKAEMRPIWTALESMSCPLDNKWRKCNSGEGDPRESIFAVLVFVLGVPPAATQYPFALYQLMIDYEIEFKNPVILDTSISDTSTTMLLLPQSARPITTPLHVVSPSMPYNVGVAIVQNPGSSDLTPGGVYYIALDQTVKGGACLFRSFDAAYTNQAATGNTAAVQVAWISGGAGGATLDVTPITAPFADLNADGAALSTLAGTQAPGSMNDEEGREVVLSAQDTGTGTNIFEDILGRLPNAVQFGEMVEGHLQGGSANQGFSVGFNTDFGAGNPSVSEPIIVEPLSATFASLVNDPIYQTLARTSTTAIVPGFWNIFTKLGSIIGGEISGWSGGTGILRTIINAIRQRKSNPPSSVFLSNPENVKMLALEPHIRWLHMPKQEAFRQADKLGILEWKEFYVNFRNEKLTYKRAFVHGSLLLVPSEKSESEIQDECHNIQALGLGLKRLAVFQDDFRSRGASSNGSASGDFVDVQRQLVLPEPVDSGATVVRPTAPQARADLVQGQPTRFFRV